MKVLLNRVGEIAHLDADGTPEELATFVNLSGLAGFAPKPREGEFPRRVKSLKTGRRGSELSQFMSPSKIMMSVVYWDALGYLGFAQTNEIDGE